MHFPVMFWWHLYVSNIKWRRNEHNNLSYDMSSKFFLLSLGSPCACVCVSLVGVFHVHAFWNAFRIPGTLCFAVTYMAVIDQKRNRRQLKLRKSLRIYYSGITINCNWQLFEQMKMNCVSHVRVEFEFLFRAFDHHTITLEEIPLH